MGAWAIALIIGVGLGTWATLAAAVWSKERRDRRILALGSDRSPALVALFPVSELVRDPERCALGLAGKVQQVYVARITEFTMPHMGRHGGVDGSVQSESKVFVVDTNGVTHQFLGHAAVGELEEAAEALARALDVPFSHR